MRLGFLGPADGHEGALARAADVLLHQMKVHRAIYLGVDGALDEVVARWARKLVGDDPTDDAAWRRAAKVALSGTPEVIDAFVQGERARLRLRALETLPPGGSRSMEMVGDRVAVIVHDKSLLDEEDIFAAHVLVFGKSDAPLVKKVGARWFVSPGHVGSPSGGVVVLDDEGDEVVASIYDANGTCTLREPLVAARGTKMKIQGGA